MIATTGRSHDPSQDPQSEQQLEQRLDPSHFVRPELRGLSAYTLDQVEAVHKLDQNEVPWDLPRRLKDRALDRLRERNWANYPDFHSDRLRALLAKRTGWTADGILVGNGSNELLGVALECLVSAETEVLGADPTFGLYEMFVRRAGGRTRFLAPRPDLRLPMEELLREVERDPKRPLLLCSPNNPTGDAASPEQIAELLDRLEAPLLLDNAYGEFCRYDYLPLLSQYPHLILFRTFSKAWSLAGLRLGYLLADPRLVAQLIKIKLPYNLGHAGAVIGEVALEHPGHAERCVSVLIGRRLQWQEMLSEMGLEVLPSEGNFLLARSSDSERIRETLAGAGILVREVGHYPGLRGCLRFAVGSGRALRATREALAGMSPSTWRNDETGSQEIR